MTNNEMNMNSIEKFAASKWKSNEKKMFKTINTAKGYLLAHLPLIPIEKERIVKLFTECDLTTLKRHK